MLEIFFIVLIPQLPDFADALADCGAPSYSLDVDQSCIAIGSITPPDPTIEGAAVKFPCASLLIRTKAPFDYCPVKVCQSTGEWSEANLSCGAATECYNASIAYTGMRICTTSGKLCQRWDTQSPHPHSFTDSNFPNNNITKSGAYCRDPGGVRGEPWCYTTDPSVEWETCDIPDCTAITTDQGTCPNDYCGDPDPFISTDNTCLLSTVTTDGSRNVWSYIEYSCLSLIIGFNSQIDYCPAKMCKNDTYWSTTKISCGSNECYTPGQSQLYRGRRICTRTGKPCQRWDSQTPHPHSYTTNSYFSDGTVTTAGAYCRDPGGVKGIPWCYTTTAEEWDYCGIPSCTSLPLNYGSCESTPAATSSSTMPSTTTSTSTTASDLTSAATTFSPDAYGDYQRYLRVNNDRSGFEKQYTIPFVKNALACARICSEQSLCVFLTFETVGTCSLYKEESQNGNNISCTTKKCYIHDNLL